MINFVMLNLIVFYVLDAFTRVHDGEARKMLTDDEQEIVRREFAKVSFFYLPLHFTRILLTV